MIFSLDGNKTFTDVKLTLSDSGNEAISDLRDMAALPNILLTNLNLPGSGRYRDSKISASALFLNRFQKMKYQVFDITL